MKEPCPSGEGGRDKEEPGIREEESEASDALKNNDPESWTGVEEEDLVPAGKMKKYERLPKKIRKTVILVKRTKMTILMKKKSNKVIPVPLIFEVVRKQNPQNYKLVLSIVLDWHGHYLLH